MCGLGVRCSAKERKQCFFEKSTKKLLLVSGDAQFTCLVRLQRATDKSSLVLSFKKELLP
jgi:uncharacterized LabA/DUF88 family protein